MVDIPTVVDKSGLQPISPTSILAALISMVAATNPGYTANLPGSLIEDISSTDVAAISLCDSFRIELVNSLTPRGANDYLLNQLGQQAGVPIGQATNTSVFCQFTGTVNFVIVRGFTVTDGTYQYTVQDGGAIGSGGVSALLFCLATVPGSWPIAAGSVNRLVTSVPGSITLSVTNPSAGLPSLSGETSESYRARVLQAEQVVAQGMPTILKTLVGKVDGVQPRLVSVRKQSGGGWSVIVGGGDPYEVAYAIYQALFDISTLVGSTINVLNFTATNPGVVTTDLNHGYTTGQVVAIAGVNPGTYDGPYTITVVDEKTFSVGVDTSGFGAYVGGGVVTPNFRNVTVSVLDYPDTYNLTFVVPPQQSVAIAVTWNTISTNFVSPLAISQAAAPALAAYINAIPVGAPINEFELIAVFQAAVSSVLDPQLLTRLLFSVAINSVGTSPVVGTGIINGDPESYFFALESDMVISQG